MLLQSQKTWICYKYPQVYWSFVKSLYSYQEGITQFLSPIPTAVYIKLIKKTSLFMYNIEASPFMYAKFLTLGTFFMQNTVSNGQSERTYHGKR